MATYISNDENGSIDPHRSRKCIFFTAEEEALQICIISEPISFFPKHLAII